MRLKSLEFNLINEFYKMSLKSLEKSFFRQQKMLLKIVFKNFSCLIVKVKR